MTGSSEHDRDPQDPPRLTLAQVRAFLAGAESVDFEKREAAYGFIAQQLTHFDYPRLTKADKGAVRDFLIKVSSASVWASRRFRASYWNCVT